MCNFVVKKKKKGRNFEAGFLIRSDVFNDFIQ